MKRLRSIILLVVAMINTTAMAQKTLEEYVYWIDNDISASQSLGASGVTIDVGSLSKGIHTFTMRVKDNTGLWSSPVTKYFLIPRLKETGVGIVRYMYWLDDDVDNGVVVETNGNNDIVNVEVGGLSEGKHTINWRVGDSTGKWSQQVNSHLFNYVLPPTGIGALSSDINLALHDNLQAGYCTEYDAELEHILVEDLTTIPANTGVLLRGRGSEKVTLLEAEDNAVAEDNQLNASIGKILLTPSETIDGETNFLIGSVDDWKEFVAKVSSKPNLNAVMTADIDLGDDQTKIGTYKGVFDGQGHTLTVHLTGSDNISPFVTISNAQIKNLHVAGTISVSGMRGAGIASYVSGNSSIENCHSSVVITTSRSGDFDGGGFIGRVDKGNTVTLSNCLFDGQLLKSGSANSCGGFVGWTQDGASATLENCLFNPSAPVTIDVSSSYVDKLRTFVSGYSGGTITNCYYTSTYGEVQGTDATGMGTSDLVTALGAGWEIQNNQVVPIMTVNSGDYTNFYLNDSRFLKVESLVILPANRSYLRLPSSVVGETKVVKLWWGNEELSDITTGFIPIENGKLKIENEANAWYGINGQKLSGKPTAKGIYIRNGKKIILK